MVLKVIVAIVVILALLWLVRTVMARGKTRV